MTPKTKSIDIISQTPTVMEIDDTTIEMTIPSNLRQISIPIMKSNINKREFFVIRKLIITLSPTLLMGFFILFWDHSNVALSFAWLAVFLNTLAFIFWFYYIFTTKKFRLFRSLMGTFNEYARFPLVYGIQEYSNKTVLSISSLLSIKGSEWNLLWKMHTILSIIGIICTIIVKYDKINKKNNINIILSTIFAYIGLIGIQIITSFDINTKNILNTIFHYIGSFLMLFSGFSVCLIEHWSLLSMINLICLFLSLIIYLIVFKLVPYKSDKPKIVHISSLACILTETAIILIVTLSENWYMFSIAKL